MKIMDKINVDLYNTFSNKNKCRAEVVLCDKYADCSLYKNGKCMNVTAPFSQRCINGTVNKIEGYTMRSSKYNSFVDKFRSDECYSKLGNPKNDWGIAIVGDYIALHLIYLEVSYKKQVWKTKEWITTDKPVIQHSVFCHSTSFIKKEDLTCELIVEILNSDAMNVMGRLITEYSNKIVPNVLYDMETLMPELYNQVIEEDPNLKELTPNFVGRYAYCSSIKDGTIIRDNYGNKFIKEKGKLICDSYNTFLPFESKLARIEIDITEKMLFKVEDNSQVDKETIFK